jgi:hypothetical protein
MIFSIAALAVLHLFISLIYFAFILHRKSLQQSIYRFIVVFFLPGLGLLFLLFSGILGKIIKETENIEESYQEYIKDSEQITYIQDIDYSRELNTIPLSDSLSLGTIKQRRAFLVDLLKKDYTRYISVLQRAVSNEDSETSHYAGAALMEIKRQFEELLRERDRKYSGNKDNINALKNNIETIKKYLDSGLPDEVEKQEYSASLSYMLEKYLEKDRLNKMYFIDKINLDLKLGNLKEAEKFSKDFCRFFVDDHEPYFMLMKYFFKTNNIKSIKKVLNHIKDRQFSLDEKNRQLLDYWERHTEGVF